MSGNVNALVEFEYTYATPGLYPLSLAKYYDGNQDGSIYHFVYENCNE